MNASTQEAVADCTCPNCGNKFTFEDLEGHVRKCPRERNLEFPKYLMVTSVPHLGPGKHRKFLTMGEAGPLYDSGMLKVEIRKYVLEADFSVRNITQGEKCLISQLAEDYSESK